jgi:flagellar biosynthesis/type III secretory pathway protein FliH
MSSSEWLADATTQARFAAECEPRTFVELPLASAGAPPAGCEAARAEREAQLAEAFARGRAEGLAEAEARHAQQLGTALRALAEGARALASREQSALAGWAPRALALAGELAERLLRRSLAEDLARLTPCLEEALAVSALGEGVALALALAPGDLAALRAGHATELAKWAETAGLTLQSDASLARGEAALAAGAARVELRWNEVVARLRSALGDLADEELAS